MARRDASPDFIEALARGLLVETLTGEYLPLLLQTAGAISADWARY